jgi:hypothetical protein
MKKMSRPVGPNSINGRTVIECKVCKKIKIHYGLGMCSACLRKYKRQTKPSYYLGTCYSEISRRVKTYDPLRPNYYGLEKCTKEEFIYRFINDISFLKLFSSWKKHNYERKFAPSIDRINNKLGYTLDNLQFISQSQNSRKDFMKPLKLFKNGKFFKEFPSGRDVASYLKVNPATVTQAKNTGYKIKGIYNVKSST